jgi:2,4-dienoyl-CoA reductase-like NADH-dependent reductase (Old Yellow Enzyme family)
MFVPGHIGDMVTKNRLVRSAAAADLAFTRQLTDRIISIHRKLAEGGVGLIITGELPIGRKPELRDGTAHYTPLLFDGVDDR